MPFFTFKSTYWGRGIANDPQAEDEEAKIPNWLETQTLRLTVCKHDPDIFLNAELPDMTT